MTVKILQTMWKEHAFDLSWEKVVTRQAYDVGVNQPQLQRKKKIPARYQDDPELEFHTNVKLY